MNLDNKTIGTIIDAVQTIGARVESLVKNRAVEIPVADAQPPFKEALNMKNLLERNADGAANKLKEETAKAFKKHPDVKMRATNLLPDAIRNEPNVKSAKANFDKAFSTLRDFNGKFIKIYAKEYTAYRTAERERKYSETLAKTKK